jgi:Tfp pilus assembly protein PilF
MKTRRTAAAVLVAFLTATSPTLPAFAQQDDAVTLQARARFKEGVDYFDKGQYENARLAFLQAYALKKHPAVLLNLAQSSAKAGHALEASKYFQQFLKESSQVSPEQKQAAESGLAEVRQKLGRVDIAAPAGTDISLDDNRVGTAPFSDPVDVEPGAHTLKSSTETVKVTATAGHTVQAKFGGASSTAVPPVVPPTEPKTETPTEPKTEVPGDTTEPPRDSGEHNGSRFSRPLKTTVPIWVGVGVGIAGIAGTITFAAFKANAQSSADSVANDIRAAAKARNLSPTGICSSTNAQVQKDFANACKTLSDNNKKVDTDAALANVSVGVAIAGGVLALVWFLAGPRESSSASAKGPVVLPYAGYGNAGLDVLYTF